jgi:ABC-type bacteriocin/lantibiotic exporter with double-glycine peptidase domain
MHNPIPNHTPVKRFWKLIRAERRDINAILTLATFHGLVGLSLPLGIQAIITFLQAGVLSTSWFVLVTLVLGGILISGWMQLRQMTITEGIEQRIFAKAAFDFSYRIPRFSLLHTHGKHFPEMMNRFFEVTTIQKGISKLLIEFSAAIVQILFGMLLLTLYHPLFILLGLILSLIIVLLFRITGRKGLESSLEESSYKYAVAHWLEELARNIYTFRHAGATELPMNKTDYYTTGYLTARNKHFKVLRQQYIFMIAFKVIVAFTLLVLGSVLVLEGSINIGQFIAAEIVILMVINSVEKAVMHMSTVYDLLTSLEKAGNVADLSLERDEGPVPVADNDQTGIHLRASNLSFTFPDGSAPVMEGISFELRSGESLCLTGEFGSGKTTLLRILSCEFETVGGLLQYNSVPINVANLSELRKRIGSALTEQHIFKGTLAENISCGRADIDERQIRELTRLAGLSEFIDSLPAGIDEPLDPEGKRLSAGTVRKIIMARSMAGRPALVIADDNLLPSANEQRHFLSMMKILCPKSTLVMVSTREEIIALCTYRGVMSHGHLELTNNQHHA